MTTKKATAASRSKKTVTRKVTKKAAGKSSWLTRTFGSSAHRAVVFIVAFGVMGVAASLFASADTSKPTMFVFGDSITARYNNTVGSSNRGWWSIVAAKSDLQPVTSAISGTGFIRKGYNCTAPSYGARLGTTKTRKAVAAAKIVIIEGGRNDYHKCLKDGRSVPTTRNDVINYSNWFFDGVKRNHPDTSSIYVLTPWGTALSKYDWIVPIVKANALAHGFHWVSTWGILKDSNTVDGTHPTTQGNIDLANAVLHHSNVVSRAKHKN